MTQTVVYTDIDLETGIGSITIKTTEDGQDTYSVKNVTITGTDKDSIRTILNNYI
ncbi:MAG: hypothetical protein IPJ60_19365 [Sphingobacteriaceae bacterium]|jgi:hypothetical protein|nr:hypothetical protein [Sphingobacteriaceae bacterium]